MKILNLLAVTLTSSLVSAPAFAGILTTSGITQISAPTTTAYPLAANLQVFEEAKNVAFPGTGIALNGGTITPGTLVDSYNIYLNTESNSLPQKTASGSITFNTPILGLIWTRSDLETSDPTFGASGTPYPQEGIFRGLESNDLSGLSNFFMAGGGNTLNLAFNIRGRGYDELRVITSAIPEPLTILGAGTALGFGVFFRKKLSQTLK
jgi:hypothetical protein